QKMAKSRKHPDRFSQSDWEMIIPTLLDSVDRCAKRMQPVSEAERVQYVSLYLADAHYAARSVTRAAQTKGRSREGLGHLFTEEDAARHLCFPMNMLVG